MRNGEADSSARFLMRTALSVAVPLNLADIDMMRARIPARDVADVLHRWATEAADSVAHHGDILMYGGGRRGEVADVFNHLGRGLAALATAPGGCRFLGVMWCARHSRGGRDAEPQELVCRHCVSDGDGTVDENHPLARPRYKLARAIRAAVPDRRYL